jgi:hypothetical protein
VLHFDIDRTFWEVLCVDHLKLLRNTVLWANSEAPVVSVEGPGLLDVVVWRNPGSITVHLVNLTNPMAMKGPYRSFFPVGPHTVQISLASDLQPKKARLLAAEADVDLSRSGTVLTVRVPSILDHEVVAIDL